jgi:hypothetical protein
MRTVVERRRRGRQVASRRKPIIPTRSVAMPHRTARDRTSRIARCTPSRYLSTNAVNPRALNQSATSRPSRSLARRNRDGTAVAIADTTSKHRQHGLVRTLSLVCPLSQAEGSQFQSQGPAAAIACVAQPPNRPTTPRSKLILK